MCQKKRWASTQTAPCQKEQNCTFCLLKTKWKYSNFANENETARTDSNERVLQSGNAKKGVKNCLKTSKNCRIRALKSPVKITAIYALESLIFDSPLCNIVPRSAKIVMVKRVCAQKKPHNCLCEGRNIIIMY